MFLDILGFFNLQLLTFSCWPNKIPFLSFACQHFLKNKIGLNNGMYNE